MRLREVSSLADFNKGMCDVNCTCEPFLWQAKAGSFMVSSQEYREYVDREGKLVSPSHYFVASEAVFGSQLRLALLDRKRTTRFGLWTKQLAHGHICQTRNET